jgi:glycosyltransferase involved in cell wall biosynthesis
MRVTLVNLWPRGGMAHYSAALANALARQPDVCVTAVVPREPPAQSFAANVTLAPVDVPTGNRPADLLRLPGQALHLPGYLRAIQASRPDIVHANLSTHPWELATLPWLHAHWPLAVTQHEVGIKQGEGGWRKRWSVWAGPRFADHLFVHGTALAQALMAQRSVPAARISIIPMGTPAGFAPVDTAPAADPATVLFFGRIKAYKGLDVLVEAMPQVVAQVPDVRFVVVGGEGDMAPYRQRPAAANAPVTWVNRFVDDDEVAGFFQQAAIVVLPYTDGSASSVITLAYAFARPVVASRVASLPDAVVDGVTGLLVPPRDPAALAAALVDLLRDRARCQRMGQAARQWAATHLAWDGIAAQTVAVYQQLLTSRRGSNV